MKAIVLTAARQRVADCLALDMSYAETARELKIARDTVKAHVFAIAQLIPNPHGLPQKDAVVRWLKSGKPGIMQESAESAIHTAL